MYCNKKNVNILTSLMVAHGVRHVVVCPGSRNAPLVHNFSQCDAFVCHQATDERSAGFIALGLKQQCEGPVAVCVTSGSALLNVLPSVAEATYQHQGIIVISADRPQAWVDQLDGQTLPQKDALGPFVAISVSLPEVNDKQDEWHCNRLVNEAILVNKAPGHPSVHINVPLSEPLFDFKVDSLPDERIIKAGSWSDEKLQDEILESYSKAKRPMVVMGHMGSESKLDATVIASIYEKAVVLSEPISMNGLKASYTDQMFACSQALSEQYRPDWVLYVGGHTVSKRLRQYLRSLGDDTMQILVSADGRLRDVSQHTRILVHGDAPKVLSTLSTRSADADKSAFIARWEQLRSRVAGLQAEFEPSYSQMLAVKRFEALARKSGLDACSEHDACLEPLFYYANSMSVRLAALYAEGYCQCNRGVNGIEGSLSVAAGASLADAHRKVYCVIGDLSFFYDQNALWQTLGGNLRILLLNNAQGGIFRMLGGLEKSPVRDTLVSAAHNRSAEGVCSQYGVEYLSAHDPESLEEGLERLIGQSSDRPVLLEVFTSADQDENEYKRLYANF